MPHDHVIGVAGAGMSAIAHVLLDQGHTVTGCDQQRNALAQELIERGMRFFQGHHPSHLAEVDRLIASSALKADHPELTAARERGLQVLKRADIWQEWSQQKPTLAVAGTHGKTTTTAMCTVILNELQHDPAYIVPAGGPVPGLERFARWGSGPFVIEADEYDRLFLGLLPATAIITSVDWDHVDIYATPADVEQTFAQFARQVSDVVITCADDAGAERVALSYNGDARLVRYGFAPHADWRAADVQLIDGWTHFVLHTPDQIALPGRLGVPGLHNVQNAVGAIAAVAQFGVAPEDALRALQAFRGAARRFEWKGEARGVTVIDDYAHNPAKVRAVLQAARMRFPDRRLVVYVQPHTFSRTEALIDEFAHVFAPADVLLVGDIYPSRERSDAFPGIDASFVVRHIQQPAAQASGDLRSSTDRLLALLQPSDVLLTLGAGDGNKVGEWVLEGLKAQG